MLVGWRVSLALPGCLMLVAGHFDDALSRGADGLSLASLALPCTACAAWDPAAGLVLGR
jgi:hypothetical protein